jgi:hypothetical protein
MAISWKGSIPTQVSSQQNQELGYPESHQTCRPRTHVSHCHRSIQLGLVKENAETQHDYAS